MKRGIRGAAGGQRLSLVVWGGLCIALAGLSLPKLTTAVLVNRASLLTLQNVDKVSFAPAKALEEALGAVVAADAKGPVYRKLGQIYLMSGRPQQAVAVLTLGAALYPDDQLLALELGDALEGLGDRLGALQQWRRAGITPQYLAAQGIAYHLPGHQLDRRSKWEIMAQLWPESSSVWFLIGSTRWNEGSRAEAIDALEKATTLDRAWTQEGDRYLANFYLGNLLEGTAHLDRAYLAFKTCLDMAEADRSYENVFRVADLHMKMGILRQRQGRSKEAVDHLSQAVTLGVDEPDTYYWLSLAEHEEKKYEQALQHVELAILKKSDVPSYYQHQAQLYLAMKNKTGAINALDRALKLAPADTIIQKALLELQSQ